MNPLLSVIIPTKNRQSTAVFAVQSVLNIISDEIEVVVQDCSDNDSLKEILFKKFNLDSRLKYFHTNEKPSLTDNWNLAISHTTGKFICGIGDDDAILPTCLEVTKWMDKNKIHSVLGAFVNYIWKDAYVGFFSNGRLTHQMNYSGDFFEVDVAKECTKKVINCGFGYAEDLPNLYHGIIEKSFLEKHKLNSGNYLASTSFDVYNAIILSSYIKKSYYLDYPLTIRGTSGASNANRIHSKKNFDIHFSEFKDLQIPEILPNVLSCEVSIAESAIIALQDTNRIHLINKMNLAVVYGKTAAIDLINSLKYFNQYRKRKNSHNSILDFFKFFYKFSKDRLITSTKNLILKTIFYFAPNSEKLIEKYANKRKTKASDISAAIELVQNHLLKNDLFIKFNHKIKKLITQKTPWD
jgi:glycosyltransferase involved in cell wall biosynthesis